MLRAYHSPQVREGQWNRMFDRRLPSVVPMDYRYLARSDGSEQSYGRGAGVLEEQDDPALRAGMPVRKGQKTPYMHMTFHPLERRLDTAVWRAMFASSTMQARQFVVRGAVKVNGKKMVYPGYLLNPGDMFTVEPDLVMYATGAPKAKKNSPISREDREVQRAKQKSAAAKDKKGQEAEEDEDDAGAAILQSEEEREAMTSEPESQEDPKKALKFLMVRAKRLVEDKKRNLSAKRLQELREFSRTVQKTLSKLRGIEGEKIDDTVEGLEMNLTDILLKIPKDEQPADSSPPEMGSAAAAEAADAAINATSASSHSNPQMRDGREDAYRAKIDAALLHQALERARENPLDASKPYATPWKPRPYMSAFAFIPRYLEVNQNVCGAVYLRHPVARPGLAEAPSPFHGETMGLGFNWYLRRR